jgi:hypothetical protein
VNGKKVRFLRRIPIDPITGTTEWGLRSMQDDPESDSWGEQSVFDVYTKSHGTAPARWLMESVLEISAFYGVKAHRSCALNNLSHRQGLAKPLQTRLRLSMD